MAMYTALIGDHFNASDMDPSLIRDYKMLMDDDFTPMVQFIGATYKHRMFKEDDGSVRIIKEETNDFDYFYGNPFYVEQALEILEKGLHPSHKSLKTKLVEFLD